MMASAAACAALPTSASLQARGSRAVGVRSAPALLRPATYHSCASEQRRGARRGGTPSAVRAQAGATGGSSSKEIEALNKQFGIEDRVQVVAGPGGLPTVRLQHACGSSAEVTLYGGCIISWKQASGDEVLYIRPDAVFDKSKPISGGIPHCFPQFGPSDKMQQHGFARNVDWEIADTSADPQPDDRDPEVTLVLTDSEYSRKMWPHAFKVAYSVALHGELLRVDMRVLNTGKDPFDFTAALHSYIEVVDVAQAKVRGLKGLSYLDKVADTKNPPKKTEEREDVTFNGPTDSVYLKAPGYVELDVGTGAAVTVTSNRWEDVVVWSPWTAMPNCYRSFVCVENAQYGSPVTLKPGEFWRSQCEWAVKDL